MPDPTEVRTTSSTGGQKGVKEARYELLPTGPLNLVARLYGRGAAKYDDHNWRKGYEWSKSYGALQRHANAFWGGEDIDEELGLPHLAAVIFHAMALLEYTETHPEFDDRVATIAKRALAGVSDVEEEHDDNPCTISLPCSPACEDQYKASVVHAASYAAGVADAMKPAEEVSPLNTRATIDVAAYGMTPAEFLDWIRGGLGGRFEKVADDIIAQLGDSVDTTHPAPEDGLPVGDYQAGVTAGQAALTGGWYVGQAVDYRDPSATADSWQSGYHIQHLSTEDDAWLISATNGTQATGHIWAKYFRPTEA